MLHMKPLPPLDLLRGLFTYDPETGQLVRIKTTSSRSVRGSIAGSINRDGYLRVRVESVEYMVHRIVWKLVKGEDIPPGLYIDHIDRDRTNNKIENLRLATDLQNQNNRNPEEGVTYDNRKYPKLKKRWVATLRGKKLGYYKTKEEAVTARRQALELDPLRISLQ